MGTRAIGISIVGLVLAAVITLLAMLHGALWKFEWNWFYPWALSPYIVLAVLFLAVGDSSRATRLACVVAGASVLLAASYMYLDAMLIHVTSTSALIFIFGPLYLLLGGVGIFAVTALIARKQAARNDT